VSSRASPPSSTRREAVDGKEVLDDVDVVFGALARIGACQGIGDVLTVGYDSFLESFVSSPRCSSSISFVHVSLLQPIAPRNRRSLSNFASG
jgi:hypothetical protein